LNDITIKLEGMPELISALKAIPGGARFAVQGATKKALGSARTTIDRAIRARYNIGQQSVLSKIGRPRLGVVGGSITVKASRFALPMFTARDINPGGVLARILKDRASDYQHAFIVKGGNRLPGAKSFPIMHRLTDQRYPIAGYVAPESVAEMAATSKVNPVIEDRINEVLYKEMTRLLQGILSGSISVPKYFAK